MKCRKSASVAASTVGSPFMAHWSETLAQDKCEIRSTVTPEVSLAETETEERRGWGQSQWEKPVEGLRP